MAPSRLDAAQLSGMSIAIAPNGWWRRTCRPNAPRKRRPASRSHHRTEAYLCCQLRTTATRGRSVRKLPEVLRLHPLQRFRIRQRHTAPPLRAIGRSAHAAGGTRTPNRVAVTVLRRHAGYDAREPARARGLPLIVVSFDFGKTSVPNSLIRPCRRGFALAMPKPLLSVHSGCCRVRLRRANLWEVEVEDRVHRV